MKSLIVVSIVAFVFSVTVGIFGLLAQSPDVLGAVVWSFLGVFILYGVGVSFKAAVGGFNDAIG